MGLQVWVSFPHCFLEGKDSRGSQALSDPARYTGQLHPSQSLAGDPGGHAEPGIASEK